MELCCVELTQKGSYGLSGDFNKFTIPKNDQSIQRLFKENAPVLLDLEKITSCDSALVALLISYKHDYPDIQLSNIPEQLGKLLSLYNVKDWFH